MVMHKTTVRLPEMEDTEEVRAFFNNWSIYHKMVEHNYLCHREVYALLATFLKEHFNRAFSMMDLGCGDAGFMAPILAGSPIGVYTGVDISPVALKLAERHLRRIKADKHFICEDFTALLARDGHGADMIWIGLSFHHLSHAQKGVFLGQARSVLGRQGSFLVFEPMMREGEDRPAFLQRWWKVCRDKWVALSDTEMAGIRKHVDVADFPETFSTLQAMGRRHGFRHVESLFTDPDELYQVVGFHAS